MRAFGMTPFIFYLVGIESQCHSLGRRCSPILWGFDDIPDDKGMGCCRDRAGDKNRAGDENRAGDGQGSLRNAGENEILGLPLSRGKAVPMTSVKDEVFSSEALGKRIAVISNT